MPMRALQGSAARAALLCSLVAVSWSATPALGAPCTKFGPVIVTGTVIPTLFYGPPNFGEDPTHDAHGFAPFLKLDKPLPVRADAATATPRQVARQTQMIFSAPPYGQNWNHRHVTVAGEIFPWDNAHHHTPVMLVVHHIRAAPR